MCTQVDYLLQFIYQLLISPAVRSEGQRVTEGGMKTECVMDRDGGNCVGERRWSRAINVTSHLTAQCFNGQTLGQRAEKEESEAVSCLDG